MRQSRHGSKAMKIPILTFHKISDRVRSKYWISREALFMQLKLMKSLGYETITCQQFCEDRIEVEKPMILTFDDAYQNFLTDAMPVLDRLNMKASVFVPTGFIGKTNEWESYDITPVPHLTAGQIAHLANDGIDFQPHTVTHRNFWRISPEDRYSEAIVSKQQLQEISGQKCDVFVYPGGGYHPEDKEMLYKAGYKMALCCEVGICDTETMDRFAVKRLTNYSELI